VLPEALRRLLTESCRYPFGDSKKAIFCVFDGHAGKEAAEDARDLLPKQLLAFLNEKEKLPTDMSEIFPLTFLKACACFVAAKLYRSVRDERIFSESDPLLNLRTIGSLTTTTTSSSSSSCRPDFLSMCIAFACSHGYADAWVQVDEQMSHREDVGTTATAALIWQVGSHKYLQVANVGDSRAYLWCSLSLSLSPRFLFGTHFMGSM
jgi:serine/threonine protein phosphatase PrpC